MSDLISREDAKQQISEWATLITNPTLLDKDATMVVLDSLPSAVCDDCIWNVCNYNKVDWDALPSAEAVQGEWVRKYDDKVNCYWYECDQCGEYRPRNQFGHEYNANFCPNCGARMKGGEE